MENKPTKEEKKAFALKAIAPYFKNPDICGFDKAAQRCVYLTDDGRKCVAGKYAIEPDKLSGSIRWLLDFTREEKLFVEEARNKLTNEEWGLLQVLHDGIAHGLIDTNIRERVDKLNLFTLEELQHYAANLEA